MHSPCSRPQYGDTGKDLLHFSSLSQISGFKKELLSNNAVSNEWLVLVIGQTDYGI